MQIDTTSNRTAILSTASGIRDLIAEQHSLPQTILLHLLPGAAVTLLYFCLVPPLLKVGVNNLITLNLLAFFFLVPMELGVLLLAGWQLAVFAFLTLVWIALVSKFHRPFAPQHAGNFACFGRSLDEITHSNKPYPVNLFEI